MTQYKQGKVSFLFLSSHNNRQDVQNDFGDTTLPKLHVFALCKQTVQSDLTARLSSARWWVTTILIKMMQ